LVHRWRHKERDHVRTRESLRLRAPALCLRL